MPTYQWNKYGEYKNQSERIRAYYYGVHRCVREVLARVAPTRIQRALDIACGYGESTEILAEVADFVVGIDSSQTLIDLACKRSYQAAVEFQCARFLDASLPSHSFDVVTGIWLLNHVHSHEELRQTLGHVRTVLKPGGHALFVTPSDTFTTPRTQRIALNDFGWEQAWTVEEPELTRGIFNFGDEWIRTTVWQPLYLMQLLDSWFDVRSWDVKGTLVAEKILPEISAGPSFEVIYGRLRFEEGIHA